METPMKRLAIALAMFAAAPAFAQGGGTQVETEARPLVNAWIANFNRGDVAGMAKDVYVQADEAALTKAFTGMRDENFGKLDVYGASFCASSATQGKALVKYGRLYSFGGLMDGDEAKLFDIVKTDSGWRVSSEADVSYATELSCS
jgi:hypothetical protein